MRQPAKPRPVEDEVRQRGRRPPVDAVLAQQPRERGLPGAGAADQLDDHASSR
jgi:hypothetical protein